MTKIKQNLLSIIMLSTCGLFITGCNSTPEKGISAKEDNSKIGRALVESSIVIADAQRVIAASENAMRTMAMTEQQREDYKAAQDYVAPGMEMPIPLYSTGELENAARAVAQMTNYEFEVRNKERRPRKGVMVKVQSNGRAAHELIKDLGSQAGERADVVVRVFSKGESTRTEKFGVVSVVYK
jgi:hypothetical protein